MEQAPEQGSSQRRPKSVWRRIRLIVLLALLLVAGWTGRGAHVAFKREQALVAMRDLYEALVIRGRQAGVSFPQDGDLARVAQTWPDDRRRLIQCEACARVFMYRPVPGPVRAELSSGPEAFAAIRPILWCPQQCYGGGRLILLENSLRFWVTEDEFQRIQAAGRIGDVLSPPHR